MEKGKMGSWGVNSQFIRDLALLIPVSDEIHVEWRCVKCGRLHSKEVSTLASDAPPEFPCLHCGSEETLAYLKVVKGGAPVVKAKPVKKGLVNTVPFKKAKKGGA